MGNVESLEKGIQEYVKTEFERVRKDKTRDYLILGEILQIKSQEEYPFTFAHLGILFVLDDDMDGRVTLDELINFAQFCNKNMKNYKTYEFQSQLQAFTTQELWQEIKREGGEDDVIAWVGRLLHENEEVFIHESNQEEFIKMDTVKHLYEFCNVKVMNGMDLQRFFCLLQQCGEEADLMALECKELDDYVPLKICQLFAREFIRGLSKLMRELGFDN